MANDLHIAAAGNTMVPAVLCLREKGYSVANHFWDDKQEYFVATKPGLRFTADDPETVLGLVTLYEMRGSDWMASDDEIQAVRTAFGYD